MSQAPTRAATGLKLDVGKVDKTFYNDLNQYHVVMGVAPAFWQSPETLKEIYVSTSGGAVSGTFDSNRRCR